MHDSATSLRPAALAAFIVGFLVIRAALFAVTTAGEFALYRDYAIQARDTSLAELHRARDIEYPPLATLFGVGVLFVADHLPDGVERLTVLRPETTLGVDHARYEVAPRPRALRCGCCLSSTCLLDRPAHLSER